MDTRAAAGESKSLLRTPAAVPEGGGEGPGFFSCSGQRQERCSGPEKGKRLRDIISPTATCRAGPATQNVIPSLPEEPVIGVIAWFVAGPGAGPRADRKP